MNANWAREKKNVYAKFNLTLVTFKCRIDIKYSKLKEESNDKSPQKSGKKKNSTSV